MSKAIMITSFKGGVGKTTISAALAVSLACLGKKTVALDMDFGTRGLDIALAMENSIGAGVIDILRGDADIADAPLATERENLSFVPAPSDFSLSDLDGIGQEQFDKMLASLKSEFDIVLLDMPAGNSIFFDMLKGSAELDNAIVVTTDNVNSIRAAEKTAGELVSRGIENVRLLINSYDFEDPDNNTVPILELIKRTSVPIIGIMPYTPYANRVQNDGKTLSDLKKDSAAVASQNIARRICGERILLLDKIVNGRKRKLFY